MGSSIRELKGEKMSSDLIAVIGMILTNIGFLWGLRKYFDGRISRMYARLDEVKAQTELTYVRKDNCNLLHTATADNLFNTEKRMDVRFDKLELKVENAFTMILNLIKNNKEH